MTTKSLQATNGFSLRKLGNWRDGMLKSFALTGLAMVVGGCSFYARSPDDYRDATAALLATKGPDLNACYDNAVKAEPNAAGNVTVLFTVEKKTGRILNVAPDPARTTAPPSLVACVVSTISGLVLNPPDQRDGMATFEYDFARPTAAAPAPPPPVAAPAPPRPPVAAPAARPAPPPPPPPPAK